MRKALIAVITAAVLFAVGAFAADLAVSSDDVASGQDAVESCATAANITEYSTTTDVDIAGEWQANGATVELTEAEGKSCDNAIVDIAIRADGSWVNGTGCSQTSGDGTTTLAIYSCTFPTTDVNPIDMVSVLVNGNTLPATTP